MTDQTGIRRALADSLARYATSTDATVAILTAAQQDCYRHDDEPDWLAGYRCLTRARYYVQASRWPAVEPIAL